MTYSVYKPVSSRRPVVLALILAMVLLTACRPQPQLPAIPAQPATPGVVAYIGDEAITEAQWQQARAYAQATLTLLGEPGAQLDEQAVFQSFLEDLLLARAAAPAGVRVSDAAIDAEEQRMLQVGNADAARLAAVLAQVGLSREGWREELGRSILAGNYLEDVALAGVAAGKRDEQRRIYLQNLRSQSRLQVIFKPQAIEGLRVGNVAPDFELDDLNGKPLRLNDLRGKAVILNFWATWCEPCRQEMPLLQKAFAQYAAEGLVIVGVDLGEEPAVVQNYVDQLGVDFPIALDRQEQVSRRYRVFGLPTSFFIDRQGVIDYMLVGPVSDKLLQRQLPQTLRPKTD